jgi:peptidyl-prolyl cis-trans isomerase C
MSFKSLILLTSAAAVLALSACNSKDSAKSATADSKQAAATVNGTVISKSRVDLIARQGASAGHADTPESRKAIIDQLAMQMLVSEEAIKKGLDKSPEVQEQIDVVKQSVLANTYIQDYIKNNPVSDDELKAEYEKVKAQATGTEYKARHILVATEAEAKDIIAKLKKDPSAFEALAKEKSLDPGSKANGGDLGWFDARSMVPEFSNAVVGLDKGKVADAPVKTQFGYHVIQLEDSRPVQAPPLDQVKAELTKHLQQQKLKKLVDDLKAKAKIEIVEAPAAPAPAPAPAK